jgi:hypothetical protein
MARNARKIDNSRLILAFADAGKTDVHNAKVDAALIVALQGAFKGRKPTSAGYKEHFKAMQATARLAYVTGRLGVQQREAERLDGLKGYKDGGEADTMRTPKQEDAFNAFKMRWSRMLKKAGVSTPETRGGARPKAAQDAPEEKVAPIVPAPTTPAVGNPEEHVQIQAAALLAYSNKHAAKLPLGVKEAIIAFHKTVQRVCEELKAE